MKDFDIDIYFKTTEIWENLLKFVENQNYIEYNNNCDSLVTGTINNLLRK